MTDSPKNRTNRKWTSNQKYRDSYEKIFGKKTKVLSEDTDIENDGEEAPQVD